MEKKLSSFSPNPIFRYVRYHLCIGPDPFCSARLLPDLPDSARFYDEALGDLVADVTLVRVTISAPLLDSKFALSLGQEVEC